jgi:hypothetical protein
MELLRQWKGQGVVEMNFLRKAVTAFMQRFGPRVRCFADCRGTCRRGRWDAVARAQEYICRRCSRSHTRYVGKPGRYFLFPSDIRAACVDEPPLWGL